MGRKVTLTQAFLNQRARFAAVERNKPKLMKEAQSMAREEMNKLTTTSPKGKERERLLARLGHPLGRGASAALRTPTGRKRGARGTIKSLPIGEISGRLRRGKTVKVDGTKITVGFKQPGGGFFRVRPGGTKKMVDGGFWAPGEGGAMGKRMKAIRLGFRERFYGPLRKK